MSRFFPSGGMTRFEWEKEIPVAEVRDLLQSFAMSQLFASGDQSIGASASASVLSVNMRVDFLED